MRARRDTPALRQRREVSLSGLRVHAPDRGKPLLAASGVKGGIVGAEPG